MAIATNHVIRDLMRNFYHKRRTRSAAGTL
jgi:hypothetical protein